MNKYLNIIKNNKLFFILLKTIYLDNNKLISK